MVAILRTTSENPDFQELVRALDQYLAFLDGDEHAFYAQFNKTAFLQHVLVAYEEGVPVGCGAIRELTPEAMEVKRMYVLPELRGKGIATAVLGELETWSRELGYVKCVLETGKRQPEAIGLYKKSGYSITPNYGQYVGVENSVCFAKML